ncbi:MAG TPA: hypothetical protein VGB98_10100 [Pyrinomonadaceae bacterium]|jgi:hypothetical protein
MAKMVIKRFGVFSAAKIYAVVMAGLGLVIGVPLGLIMIVFGAAMMSSTGSGAAGGGVGIGLGLFYMIGLPIMYGVFGFIFGAIGAGIYNLASRTIGGLEMELENAEVAYSAPPSPSWGAQEYQQPGQQPGQQQYPY